MRRFRYEDRDKGDGGYAGVEFEKYLNEDKNMKCKLLIKNNKVGTFDLGFCQN